MKKTMAFLLAVSLLALSSCGTAKNDTKATEKTTMTTADASVTDNSGDTTTTTGTPVTDAGGATVTDAQGAVVTKAPATTTKTDAQGHVITTTTKKGGTTAKKTTATTAAAKKTTTTTKKTTATTAPIKSVAAKTLKNTYARLTKDKALNVAYIGGSVTAGVNSTSADKCWAGLTTTWFQKNFSGAKVNGLNVGNGGTGTRWAAARIERDIFKFQKTDLLFIETSVNDRYLSETNDDVKKNLETVFRKAYKENPNMDIVVLFITDQTLMGTESDQIKAQKELCDIYGIHCINVGKAIADKIKAGSSWEYYFGKDFVHPNNTGYQFYTDVISDYLKNQLITNKPSSTTVTAQPLPTQVYSGLMQNTTLIRTGDIACPAGWSIVNEYGTVFRTVKPGVSMSFTFTGTYCGLMVDGVTGGAKEITLSADGKSKTINMRLTAATQYDQYCLTAFDNLPNGKHTFTITNTSGGIVSIQGVFYGG